MSFNLADPTAVHPDGNLTKLTMAKVQAEFDRRDHHLGDTALHALFSLAQCLEKAAKGLLEPNVYLCSLDCGTGKTTVVMAFLSSLVSVPEFNHVGVLVCLSRRKEIESYVEKTGLQKDEYAVYTGKDNTELNAMGLGKENADKARVVFSTQAIVQLACDNRRFSDVSDLLFNGRKREVVIWDESLMMAEGVHLSTYDLDCLPRRFSPSYPVAVDMIKDAIEKVEEAKDGDIVILPDFDTDSDASSNDVACLLDEFDDDRKIAAALWFLSGRSVTVRRDEYRRNNVAIDYREVLPADLMPLVCTDASGRVRGTYLNWEKSRSNLVRLPTTRKTYRNLTCNVWSTSGAKSAFASQERELCEGIVEVINKRPDEDILILVHKPRTGRYDVEKTIRGLVGVDQSHLHFLNWGAHTASNDFAKCKTVICAGTLFQRTTVIEALARAASGIPSDEGAISKETLREVEIGESKHHLMQGACRGSMRLSEGGDCSPCELFIIASERSGIPRSLREVFPECRVKRWRPVVRPLKGIVKAAVDALEDRAEFMGVGCFLPFREIMEKIGYASASNFYRDVRSNPDFQEVTSRYWLVEAPRKVNGQRKSGWLMVDFAAVFDDETLPTEQERKMREAEGDF
jgi:hypothetical protein